MSLEVSLGYISITRLIVYTANIVSSCLKRKKQIKEKKMHISVLHLIFSSQGEGYADGTFRTKDLHNLDDSSVHSNFIEFISLLWKPACHFIRVPLEAGCLGTISFLVSFYLLCTYRALNTILQEPTALVFETASLTGTWSFMTRQGQLALFIASSWLLTTEL